MLRRDTLLLIALAALCLLPSAPAHAADPIFDARRMHETRLEIDPADWQALRDNFRTNQYYAANVSFDGEVVEQVGVRSRGKGSRDEVKPGLRLDFNRYGKGRDFHGLVAVDLKNALQDTSMLREPLALAVFQAMGIEAPAIAYTRLTVNGEYWGLYSQVEEIRKPFLRDRLGEDGGNLFKYEWSGAWDFSWRGEDAEAYVPLPFEPHTNEDTLDPTELVDFIRAVNETPDERFLQEMESYIDTRRFITYLAVENALAESDGFLGDQGTNNFYLYQTEPGSRFVFIPWDKDTALQDSVWPIYRGVEQNVLARRLLGFESQRALYVQAIQRAVGEFVNGRWLLPKLEANYALIRNAALADTRKPYSNDEFEIAVEGLRGIIDWRADDVAAQRRR